MEVLTKLKNTVSTTVSQLSGVLPGNPVTREFEATRHVASAGPGLNWKIYAGHKKSTKHEVAIFVFEKRILEKFSKRDRELILERLRHGVAQLTRLRHPKILTVQHPLEESRESLAFATEPVFASLANAIGCHDNMPMPVPTEIKEYQLFEVEIKYGVLQICDALKFLHGDVRLLHRNICPESIIINKSGAWKLSGFEFCLTSCSTQDMPAQWPFHKWESDVHPHAQPPLTHLAPEYALTMSCDAASDMYSLGSTMYAVFNRGKSLMQNGNNIVTYSSFKKYACDLKTLTAGQLGCIPAAVREHVKLLLNTTPELRPDAHQFSKIPFFEDVGAKTLEYLDSLFQWDNLQKSQFYKGLPQIITKMPKRVNLYRVIPCLTKEFVNAEMVPFVLPSVLLIAEDATKEEFCETILPDLKSTFRMQEPIQILLIFMQKMELLLSKTPADDIRTHVLPMIYRALESDTHQIQELCLNILPNFANLVDYPSMKNALLPRIKRLAHSTQYLSVRVNCLVCLGKLLEHLDKWLVLDEVLPTLQEIPSREPAVLMGILGIYKLAMTNKKLGITKDVMATKVIPFLMPLSIESGLNLCQFNAIIALIKEMVNSVESEHRGKLEQLNSIQKEQSISLEMSKVHMPNKLELISGIEMKPFSKTDEMFHGLGLGNYVEEKDVSKTATELEDRQQPVQMTGTGASKANPASGKFQNFLSLEQKEKLALEQEKQRQLKAQPALQANRTTLQKQTSASTAPMRDLTSSLIQSNLVNMSLSSGSISPIRPATSQHQHPVVVPNYNIEARALQLPVASAAAVGVGSFQTSNGGISGWSASPVAQPLSYSGSQRPGAVPSNMTSLDNLMMSSSRVNKVSMNQMAATNQIVSPVGALSRPMLASPPAFGSSVQLHDSNKTVTSPAAFPGTTHSSASSDLFDLLG